MRPWNRHPTSDLPQDIWIIILAFLDAKSYVHLHAVNKAFFAMIPDIIKTAEEKVEESTRVKNLVIISETAQAISILQNVMRFPGKVDIFNLPTTLRKPLNQAITAFSENNPVRAKRIAKVSGF